MGHTADGTTAIASWWQQYRARARDADSVTVELFLRSYTPTSRHVDRSALVESVTERVENGMIDDYDVTVVGDRICVCDCCTELYAEEDTYNVVTDLVEWRSGPLETSGVSERAVESEITGEYHHTLTLPEQALGVFVDDALVGVFPCTDGVRTYEPATFLSKRREQAERADAEHSEPVS